MQFQKEIIKDGVVLVYKGFCSRNRLIEDENTAEYFITYFVNMDTKAGYGRAEKLREYVQKEGVRLIAKDTEK